MNKGYLFPLVLISCSNSLTKEICNTLLQLKGLGRKLKVNLCFAKLATLCRPSDNITPLGNLFAAHGIVILLATRLKQVSIFLFTNLLINILANLKEDIIAVILTLYGLQSCPLNPKVAGCTNLVDKHKTAVGNVARDMLHICTGGEHHNQLHRAICHTYGTGSRLNCRSNLPCHLVHKGCGVSARNPVKVTANRLNAYLNHTISSYFVREKIHRSLPPAN